MVIISWILWFGHKKASTIGIGALMSAIFNLAKKGFLVTGLKDLLYLSMRRFTTVGNQASLELI